MSLRSVGYLIARRFYPRKIYRLQAEFSPGIVSQAASMSAAGRPGRSLHTLRDLGAADNAFGGALVAAALAGGVGILIIKKHPDDADSNVANEDTKEVSRKTKVTGNKLLQEVSNVEKQDVDMEAMFHEWMKQVGRVYPNQEEETKRFEIFKKKVKQDPQYGKLSDQYVPKSELADRTIEEVRAIRGCVPRVYTDKYFEELEAFRRIYEQRKQELEQKLREKETSTTDRS